MSNVIVKMDSKVLDDLVRKECIEFTKWINKEGYNISLLESKRGLFVDHKNSLVGYNYITTEQLYDLYKSQSKEKVND